MIRTTFDEPRNRPGCFLATGTSDDQKPCASANGEWIWNTRVEGVITCHFQLLHTWRVFRCYNIAHALHLFAYFICRTLLLYASELRFGSGLNPLPFFMYPSRLAAVMKFIFFGVPFLVGIVRLHLHYLLVLLAPICSRKTQECFAVVSSFGNPMGDSGILDAVNVPSSCRGRWHFRRCVGTDPLHPLGFESCLCRYSGLQIVHRRAC